MVPVVHVMVGVLRDRDGRILINQRPAGKVQAGRWEFPGGKLESAESPEAGLRRELHEELGIVAGPMQRLIELHHVYPEFSVRLDVREILHFGGTPQPRESQALKWVHAEGLSAEDILEADHAIVQALRLPDRILVTPDAGLMPRERFLAQLRASLLAGTRMVQLRAKSLEVREYIELAEQALAVCRAHDARLVLNAAPDLLRLVAADGVHLDRRRLRALHERPIPSRYWLSAACHSTAEIRKAQQLGVDFVLIGAVNVTPSHPGEAPIGWAGFRAVLEHCNVPAFALGGMSSEDVLRARQQGARGVAAIRSLWSD